MTDKEILALPDPEIIPTDELIAAMLGEKFKWWTNLVHTAKTKYPNITEIWKYYKDGGQWLFRLMNKKNTILWVALLDDTFRVTFYFTIRAETIFENSDLPPEIIENFISARLYGKIKPVSIKMTNPGNVNTVLQLVDIKLKAK